MSSTPSTTPHPSRSSSPFRSERDDWAATPTNPSRRSAPFCSERGASPIGTLIILFVVIMLIDLTVMGARVSTAHHDIQSAVRESARQGTLAQTGSSAGSRAQHVANRNLEDLPCVKESLFIDAGPFEGGETIGVRASCDVPLSDLSFLNLPYPSVTVSVEAIEIIDTYRAVN